MDNKLSELSKPVAYLHRSGKVVTREECSGDDVFAICCKVEKPIYSQEYVSALLAELEEKDNRIAELEAYNAKLRDWNSGLAQESCELQAKLAMPVRLPNKNDDEFWFGSTFQVAKFDRAVERAISAADFTVEGDE